MNLRRLVLAFALLSLLVVSAPAQTNNQGPAQSPAAAAAPYPDTPEGLQKQLEDILLAYRAGDTEKAQRLINNFCVPDPAAAWSRIFGSEPRKSLAEGYSRECSNFQSLLALNLRLQANEKKVEIRARLLVPAVPARPSQSGEPTPQATAPVKIYVWELRAGTQNPVTSADLFAYLDGAFRFLGELPPPLTGTPERIRVGSNVMVTKLLHMVPPTYPPLAQSAGIQGTVRLSAVIAKDGTVQELNVLEGHPVLAKAAVEAVRQWRYQPTLLDGKPVEVVTTIDVNFARSR